MNEPKRRGRPPKVLEAAPITEGVSLEQAYANRVWNGQSPSLPYGERWYRVKLALEAQGMSMDGVVLK
jgi:hypothetical protein